MERCWELDLNNLEKKKKIKNILKNMKDSHPCFNKYNRIMLLQSLPCRGVVWFEKLYCAPEAKGEDGAFPL